MSDELEERLREYGSVLDRATTVDVADRNEQNRQGGARHAYSARQLVVVLVVIAVATVAALAVATSGSRSRSRRDVNEAPASTTTTTAVGLTLTPEQRTQCTPSCPEEGPTLTPQQKRLFAMWRSEYDPAEVAYVTRGDPGADDASVVGVMTYRVACRATYAALQAAERASPEQRDATVDAIMVPALATIEQRNWPPGSATPQIFGRFATLLKAGDFASVSAEVKVGPGSGQCQDALNHRW